jgi:ribosomal protein S18 acetylase RimI-like enzyme
VIDYARSVQAHCVWVETQNVNVPAISFYGRRGFRLCGLDTRLYDPAGAGAGETALFFALDLD